MEFILQGRTAVHTEGSIMIELPDYMVVLPEPELQEALSTTNNGDLIIAAGRHQDGDIVLLTGSGDMMEIDCVEASLPTLGRVVPAEFGRSLLIEITCRCVIKVSSRKALDHSTTILSRDHAGVTQTSYVL